MKNRDLGTHPLRGICDDWLAKIELALQDRHEKFGQYAEEAHRFFDCNHDWMWQDKYSRGPSGFLDKEGGILPTFRISVNKLFEAVALFGPALYHQNPNVQVSPLQPPEVSPEALGISQDDPMRYAEYEQLAQLDAYHYERKKSCASVKSKYLNWLQYETDKKTHSRRAIVETIISGLGYLETKTYSPPHSTIQFPRSTYLSWWDVVVDPDAKYWEDVQWIAIRRVKPVNLTERTFGLEPGDLIGHMQSRGIQGSKRAKKEAKQNRGGESYDLIEYWEVFSKNGFGDKLKRSEVAVEPPINLEALGDYTYAVVSRGIPFPLNLPTSALLSEEPEQMFARAQWPIPYWYDTDGWPISRLMFYDKPNEIWPISMFRPAIGELRFVNWCLSFLADKVAANCHTYVGILKEAAASIQKQIGSTSSPYTVIELSAVTGKSVNDVVQFLQAPDFAESIWRMVAEVLELIDKRTGLTELVYGLTSRQIRSATEANVRDANLSVRPDDMASKVEDFLSEVAVREMQAARWTCEEKDVAPCLGYLGTKVWAEYIMTSDVTSVVMDYDYRIEAGSARKPNKNNRIAQLQEFSQNFLQPSMQLAVEGGNPGPYNAFILDWSKAMDFDGSPYLIQPPDPAAAPPSPEETALQVKMAEFELKLAEMQAKLGFEREKHEMDMEHDREKHKVEIAQQKEEGEQRKAEAKVQLQVTKEVGKAKAAQARKPKPSPKKQ
jgi:hypothetical protein